MIVSLKKADLHDCEKIHQMQILGFKALLEAYQDFETNPGAETLEQVKKRFEYTQIDHYFVRLRDDDIGYIRIRALDPHTCRLSQILILPEHQGNGYAQQAIRQVETRYPLAKRWLLNTIEQERKLCHLYEKLGYRLTGTREKIKDGMDLVDYEK